MIFRDSTFWLTRCMRMNNCRLSNLLKIGDQKNLLSENFKIKVAVLILVWPALKTYLVITIHEWNRHRCCKLHSNHQTGCRTANLGGDSAQNSIPICPLSWTGLRTHHRRRSSMGCKNQKRKKWCKIQLKNCQSEKEREEGGCTYRMES